jgi:SAM-dependent methyltransferase
MDSVFEVNKHAWNRNVQEGNPWTLPVTHELIEAARKGEWEVLLTNCRPVPRGWFPDMAGLDVLCLASGGGQQGPIFAAAGANVTILDISPAQLAQDRMVAEREGLELEIVEGSMDDLVMFADKQFDLIFHPISNLYCPHVRPVWREAYRVLRPGGSLLAGFVNPVFFLFDKDLEEEGIYQLKYALPYADHTSLGEAERLRRYGKDSAIEFSHTLEDQIGGQTEAGFHIVGFYESYVEDEPIREYMPTFMASRALKLQSPGI